MRIIGGEKGGLRLKDFKGDWIRPTSDKVKGAVFSALLSENPKMNVFVDLFSGTGAMGIEARSRGMEEVYLFDKDPRSLKIIKENLERAKYPDIVLTRKAFPESLAWLELHGVRADVIFMDPPYRLAEKTVEFFHEILEKNLLSDDGILVLEHDKTDIIGDNAGGLRKVKEKTYGNTIVSFFKR